MKSPLLILKVKKLLNKFMLTIIIGGISTLTIFCQLTGSYTIGDGQNYPDISAAIAELQLDGITGPVVFNIIPGTYNVHVQLKQVAGGSETNSITFQSSTQDSSDVILQYYQTDNDDNWIFLLDGPDYINFNHLTFKAKGESLYGTCIKFDGFSSHVSFNNNAFFGKYTTSATASATIIAGTVSNYTSQHFSYLTFKNNYFNKGSYAIHFQGPNDKYMSGTVIDGNIFEETGYCCAYCNFNYAPIITNNSMEAVSYGIRVNGDYGGGNYSYNKIFSENQGMSIQRYGPEEGRALISNNFVTIGSNGKYGISILNSVMTDVLNNSVNVLSNNWTSTAFYSASAVNTVSTVKVANNNFCNEYKGYSIIVGTDNVISEMNNNNLYTAGNYIASWSTNKIFDIKELQDLSGMNEHSLSVYPHYLSDRDLHSIAPWLNGKGAPVTLVTNDIDNESRGATPDIGADEFTPTPSSTIPLDGSNEYTIGNGGNYPDFKTAIADALLRGISSTVTFGFMEGTYEDQFLIKSIPGSGIDKRVIIQSASTNTEPAELKYSASELADNYVFRFHGADFVTLKNLILSAKGILYARVIDFYQGADSIIIENNTLNSPFNTNARNTISLISSDDSDFRSRIIRNNQMNEGAYGIYMRRSQNNFLYPKGAIIENNNFNNIGYSSIYLQFYESPKIIENTIESNYKGIQALSCSKDLRIQKNKINMLNGDAIYLTTCIGNEDQLGLISNNFIHCGGSSKSHGIYIINSPYQRILNNSVNMTNDRIDSRPLFISSGGSTSATIQNNIFSNTGDGMAMYVYTPSTMVNCDHNNYYSRHDYLVYWGENVTNLEALKTLNSMDEHSVFGNPHYVSNTDLHSSEDRLDSAAYYFASVPDDIDGDVRNLNYPDIGADEFIIGLNNPPEINKAIPDQQFEWNSPPQEIAFLDTVFNDPDPEDILDYSVISKENWVLASIENNILSLAVAEGANGISEIIVTATDLSDASVSDTFTVEYYIPPNNPPVAINDTVLTSDYVAIEVLKNDYDEDGDEILIHDFHYSGNATVSIAADFKSILYDPTGISETKDTIIYYIKDEMDAKDTAKIFITIFREMEGFILVDTELEGLSHGSIKWGDYDNDGDLDILQTGWTGNTNIYKSKIINNSEGVFEDSGIPLTGLSAGTSNSADWIDIDNDNDLDIIITGRESENELIKKTLIYINDAGTFSLLENTGIKNVSSSCVKWGDINQDGSYDLLISGRSDTRDYNLIYFNNDAVFTESSVSLSPTQSGENTLVDIDNDGDLDIFACGSNFNPSVFYINTGDGSFTTTVTEIPGLTNASTAWTDVDSDGDLDVAFMGNTEEGLRFQIFQNDGIGKKNGEWFTILDDFTGIQSGDLSWADFDNDGDMDLIATGNQSVNDPFTWIFRNDEGSFFEINYDIIQLARSALDCGDFDNDGDPDLAIMGIHGSETITAIYRNDKESVNLKPTQPTQLQSDLSGDQLSLQWDAATDDHSSAENITYNVAMGRSSQSYDILSPMAENSFLKKTFPGNAGYQTHLTLKNLENGTYYWSVQAIDQAFTASEFSQEANLVISGINETINEMGISIYPNPAKDKIWIKSKENGHYDISIIELSGKIIYSEKNHLINHETFELNVQGIKAGSYFIQIKKESNISWHKLILL